MISAKLNQVLQCLMVSEVVIASMLTLGILPPGAVSTIQALTTCTTSAAGLPKDLSSPREPLSREFRAASASLMIGSAAAKSLVHSSAKAVTSACAQAKMSAGQPALSETS